MYTSPRDLAVITCYFNPAGYLNRRRNFENFAQTMAGMNFFAIECAFEDRPFELNGDNIHHVRSRSVLWQKEALLNRLIQEVSQAFPKIVWADADLVFRDPDWAIKTSRLLDDYQLVQPFKWVEQLNRTGIVQFLASSFASMAPQAAFQRYDDHGSAGYAWAGRSSALKRGLYDRCIVGSGDHAFVHAIADRPDTCLDRIFNTPNQRADYDDWARDSSASLSFLQGSVRHCWHGDETHRRYEDRMLILKDQDFDPARDVELNADGCLEWSSDKPDLHRAVFDYFCSRHEDGVTV